MRSKPLKKLLKEKELPLDPSTVNKLLIVSGILEHKEYESSTGSGEIKSYLSLTNRGLTFGENKASQYTTKTEPRYYESEFTKLILEVKSAFNSVIDSKITMEN